MKKCPCMVDVTTEKMIDVQVIDEPIRMSVVNINTENEYQVNGMSEVIIRKGYSPYISEETKTWWEYDDELKGYIDTGVPASPAEIPLATHTNNGLMSAEDKVKLDNMDFTVDFSKVTGFHTLTIGDIVFDGLEDKNIPVYKGEMNNLQMNEYSPSEQILQMTIKN